MATAVELVPLLCPNCRTPAPANDGELAWVCAQCGEGMLLGAQGLEPLVVRFGGLPAAGAQGKPFWVAEGRVSLIARESFTHAGVLGLGDQKGAAQKWWEVPHTFMIPAYRCELSELTETATTYLLSPPSWQPGPHVPFLPVTLSPADVLPLAEAVVMNIEGGRKDKLKEFTFDLRLEPASLLVLTQGQRSG